MFHVFVVCEGKLGHVICMLPVNKELVTGLLSTQLKLIHSSSLVGVFFFFCSTKVYPYIIVSLNMCLFLWNFDE